MIDRTYLTVRILLFRLVSQMQQTGQDDTGIHVDEIAAKEKGRNRVNHMVDGDVRQLRLFPVDTGRRCGGLIFTSHFIGPSITPFQQLFAGLLDALLHSSNVHSVPGEILQCDILGKKRRNNKPKATSVHPFNNRIYSCSSNGAPCRKGIDKSINQSSVDHKVEMNDESDLSKGKVGVAARGSSG